MLLLLRGGLGRRCRHLCCLVPEIPATAVKEADDVDVRDVGTLCHEFFQVKLSLLVCIDRVKHAFTSDPVADIDDEKEEQVVCRLLLHRPLLHLLHDFRLQRSLDLVAFPIRVFEDMLAGESYRLQSRSRVRQIGTEPAQNW